ncbi:hypothetical protein JHK82_052571 [Glycine max]|nr:hypothetical protein JHK85_053274 [Glycine max]KAG5082419.1 hypothetical protein JHK84_052457 [Glycine max]KAG5085174.1 hypothetical protein JHK82_052571 [Glycine max]
MSLRAVAGCGGFGFLGFVMAKRFGFSNGHSEEVLFEFPVGLRVVAVDHDPTILDVILNMCSPCHYRAVAYSDVSLAVLLGHVRKYVREKTHCIDVILIEVHMPYVDSLQFLQHVTNETNVPVIMMSLDDAQSTVMKAIRNGACNYWLKPLQESLIKIGSNFEESDSDELSDSLASPALKPDKNCINNLSRL